MNSLRLRDASANDLPALVHMLADDQLGNAREIASTIVDPGYERALASIDSDLNHRLIVCEIDGEIVGTFQLSFLPGLSHRGAWRGQIEAVRVTKRLRGRGVGEQMMLWAISECRARGCRLVQLTSNKSRTEAHRFYERLGFEATHVGMKLVMEQAEQG